MPIVGTRRIPPWLAGTALLYSAVVMEKRGALQVWTILLAMLAISLSLTGTFPVRSGVLASVHTFANDRRRGIFILAILVIFIGGALALYAWRVPLLKQGGRDEVTVCQPGRHGRGLSLIVLPL